MCVRACGRSGASPQARSQGAEQRGRRELRVERNGGEEGETVRMELKSGTMADCRRRPLICNGVVEESCAGQNGEQGA